jgi:hypothetical protein
MPGPKPSFEPGCQQGAGLYLGVMMNSWEIIKEELTKKSRPGTMGRNIEMNQCAELYVRLMPNLADREAATESMNKDDECRAALLARSGIDELRKAGVLR